MRVLFLFPKVKDETPDFCPMGILYVAAFIRGKHEVRVIDDHLEKNEGPALWDKISGFRPDVIGISCNVLQVNETYALANLIKEKSGQIKIVVGGPHATAEPKEMLTQCEAIDCCVIGEGEQTMLDLLDCFTRGGDLHQVAGIAFRHNGEIFEAGNRELIQNIDTVPFPAYDLIDLSKYRAYPMISTLISRGCPFNCLFCSNPVYGHVNRRRSVANVISELEMIIENYQCKAVHFWDDTFNINRAEILEFCDEMIKLGINKKIRWACEARVNKKLLDLALLQKMKEAGCGLIGFGIEAGNQRILDTVKKRITIEEVVRARRLAKEAGIAVRGLFMIGNLGENVATVFDSIKLAERLKCDSVQFMICTPIPGSDFHEIAQKNDWILVNDYSMYTQRYPTVYIEDLSPSQMGALKNVADFVMLRAGNNLDIFATALGLRKRNKVIKRLQPGKILARLRHTRYWLKSFYYLSKYYLYKPDFQNDVNIGLMSKLVDSKAGKCDHKIMAKQDKRAEIELTEAEIQHPFTDFDLKCKKEQLEILGFNGDKKSTVLDAGCGPGSFGILLARNGNTVFGIDLSAKAVQTAGKRARAEDISFWPIVGDIECLPFESNYFDLCFCGNILHHFRDMQPVVAELVRVLKPGGSFACVENNGSNPLVRLSRFSSRHLRRVWPLLRNKDTGNIAPHNHRAYIDVLSRHGITSIKAISLYSGLPPYKDIISKDYHLWERVLWYIINKIYGLGIYLLALFLPQPYKGKILLIKGIKGQPSTEGGEINRMGGGLNKCFQ